MKEDLRDSTDGGALHDQPALILEQRIAEAVAEFIDLQSREEPAAIDEFCRRYPQLEPRLFEELQSLAEIDSMLGPDKPETESARGVSLPEKLSGHKILSLIGSGGMGCVYLAEDERLARRVAIKTLNERFANSEPLRARFLHEARAMARLSHPNVARIYNLGPDGEVPHFVMEHVEGVPLTDAARSLTLRQKAELMHKVVVAVEFLHQHHVIHRDLKPGNILVGADLEPKILDFGLARETSAERRLLTAEGEVIGTPDYFSPEQARGEPVLDARSDIFSLGVVFYQLLTDALPFRSETAAGQIKTLCEEDPLLPRRRDSSIPGDLQNVCLKALEKNPADRYSSARELADDLARFLAGEPVLAAPVSYARMMSGRISMHLRELDAWRRDHLLSEYEFDSFTKLYGRLIEREDSWILQARRLTLAQVTLYLGAWVLVVGASLIVLFQFARLSGTAAIAVVSAAAALTAFTGIRCWRGGLLRIGIAYLLAFCLLLPVALLVAMNEWHLLTSFTRNRQDLEFFARFDWLKGTTNAQMWWALCLSLPAFYALRRFTKSSVFSLVFAFIGALLCVVTLLRMGLLEWLDNDPGKAYFRLAPFALLFYALGYLIERFRHADDSRYFYPVAVTFTFLSLSGLALFHEPYAEWLKSVIPRTRGQVEYLFIINAAVYLLLQSASEKFGTSQMRWVSKSFRFVIPGHVLTSLLLLGWSASDLWHESPANTALQHEARFFELVLPLAALAFVFGSVPKQMKNFFFTGLLFLAIGIVRLQRDLFRDHAAWPLSLLILGLLLMLLAANYTPVKLAFRRFFRRWK